MYTIKTTIEDIAGMKNKPVVTIVDDNGNILNPVLDDGAHAALDRFFEAHPNLATVKYLIKVQQCE